MAPSDLRRTLRFVAMLKAACDFGLDQASVNSLPLRVDPRRPDLDWLPDALAATLLQSAGSRSECGPDRTLGA